MIGSSAALSIAALTLAAYSGNIRPAFNQRDALDREEAEEVMAKFARCVISGSGQRREAERFLRLVPSDPAYFTAGSGLATPRCVPQVSPGRTEMRFLPHLLRAVLYSAMYQRDFGRMAPPDVSAVAPLAVASEFDGPASGIPETVFFARFIGDCAARADAAGVHALLLTRIGNRTEQPALERLMPVLANCVPAGRQLRFSRSMLRGFLAEALYKLRKATSPARSSGEQRFER